MPSYSIKVHAVEGEVMGQGVTISEMDWPDMPLPRAKPWRKSARKNKPKARRC